MDLDFDFEADYALAMCGLVLCSYAAYLLTSRRRQRWFKVRPINKARRTSGNFNYYRKMKSWDSEQFFKYTRMTVPLFDKLLSKVKTNIMRQNRSDGITPEETLVVTLQYLSQGISKQILAWTYNIGHTMGHTTVHKIIHETCQCLWDILSPEYKKTPECEKDW